MTVEDCLIIHGEINKLQTELMEAYKSIVDRHEEHEGDYSTCLHCGAGDFGFISHNKDCIVLKAEQYIEDNK